MERFQSSKKYSNKKACQIISVLKINSFTLFVIIIISIGTAKITQNKANIANTNEAIGRTIPLEMIKFEILRFKHTIHLVKVHEGIKDGSKIILCEITKCIF